jgi:hypothetical protein
MADTHASEELENGSELNIKENEEERVESRWRQMFSMKKNMEPVKSLIKFMNCCQPNQERRMWHKK